ncbi:hypothetical protein J1N35_010948 [Gossypium stocksii]|uniref:Uncharacterized protein n=1 Tax=Gossypium stocksii TaxID=47602 RepID=A0A9D3W370_9ROSI|nr:hypothetical protein J1N35_010948 [Gossypium stocksii]
MVIVSLERKQVEALENFKNETLENFNNFLHGLKAKIQLHTQVLGGSFDAHRVDLNALCNVNEDQLGFDIRSPLGVAWEDFVSKWKNSKDFYLDEDLLKTSTIPADDNSKRKWESDVPSDPEGVNDVP